MRHGRPGMHSAQGTIAVVLATLAPVLLLCACASDAILQSAHVDPAQRTPLPGVSYYLPKKLISLTVWESDALIRRQTSGADGEESPPPTFFATFDGERLVPDLRHQFLIQPCWDAASHDLIRIRLTEDGLLRSVRGKAKDERAAIANELAKLASLIIRGPAPLPIRTRAGTAKWAGPRMYAHYEFDPLDPLSLQRVQGWLAEKGITLSLTKQSDCPSAESSSGCRTACTCTSPGIYYRLPIPYRLRVWPAAVYREPKHLGAGPEGSWEYLVGGGEQTVLMPNDAVCLYVPVDRKQFVTSYTSMEFDKGMLRSVTTDKPSELLGFVKIPVDVASQLLAIPSELLTLRIHRTMHTIEERQGSSTSVGGSSSVLEAERALLEAIKKYQAAKAAEEANGDGYD